MYQVSAVAMRETVAPPTNARITGLPNKHFEPQQVDVVVSSI